jgi:hypothetical protein
MIPRAPRARPPVGQLCTAPRGCTEPALPGRWACAYHAELLERLGGELRQSKERERREP